MPRVMDVKGHAGKMREFMQREGRLPGYGEMLALFGYRSKNSVFGALKKLEEHGFIEKRGGKILATPLLSGGVRILGAVQAGFPSPAEEEVADTLSLDAYLIRKPEATFILSVHGDSMINAGILPGDMVLVEKGGTPKSHDVVVAQVDNEWTLKYYIKDESGVSLEPANPRYPVIRPRLSLTIGGIVKAVIRKYG
ncbi:MAG: transcriptional repressor LexA [bacterium]